LQFLQGGLATRLASAAATPAAWRHCAPGSLAAWRRWALIQIKSLIPLGDYSFPYTTSEMPPGRKMKSPDSNTERYDPTTIWLHWITVGLIVALWVIGQTGDLVPRGPFRTGIWSVHVTLGFLTGSSF
jgi:hypothetical protein